MDPQLARVIAMMPTLDLSDVAATRALNEATRMPVSAGSFEVTVTHRNVPGPGGDVRVRVYAPHRQPTDAPAILYFHPGLFFGTLDMDHARCLRFAADVEAVVLSVEYRRAPEHIFPAAADDCYAALLDTVAHAAELGVAASRVAVAGCSTGATLAAAVALMARDRAGPAIAFQLLLQPAVDDRLQTPSMAEFAEPGPSEAGRVGSAQIWRHYLGDAGGEVSPYAAPARASDLSGLPAAYVSTNEYDCLRDEGIEYALRLIRAGVPTELHHYAGTFHAFDLVVRTAAIAKRALDEQVEVLRRGLARSVEPPITSPSPRSGGVVPPC